MNKILLLLQILVQIVQDYLSLYPSDNKKGAYELGKILSKYMKSLSWNKKEGTVGIIAIPQKRLNGKRLMLSLFKL